MELSRAALTDPGVKKLVAAVQAHYVQIYGSPDESPIDAEEFRAPGGYFALGTLEGEGVAMGGWRRRPELRALYDGADVAEIKRMYVAPTSRRRGFGQQVLAHLEQTAGRSGVGLLVLETGTMQPEAIALYEACGYSPTTPFGHYADSELARYYSKRVAEPVA